MTIFALAAMAIFATVRAAKHSEPQFLHKFLF
jgi:hypothetical protein